MLSEILLVSTSTGIYYFKKLNSSGINPVVKTDRIQNKHNCPETHVFFSNSVMVDLNVS